MTRVSAFPFILALGALAGVHEPPTRWAWFRSTSVINDWFITHGAADVTIDGRTFKATLWDSADTTWARLSLDGSIVRNAVTVTITVHNSDVGPSHATGKVERTCWPQGGGREAIILNEGFGVIGLVRELPRSAVCSAGA
jgi:hypothetical protein